jgi:hypothetical protein
MLQPNYAVPGGRLSPSVSEVDLNHPADSLRKDLLHAVSLCALSLLIDML